MICQNDLEDAGDLFLGKDDSQIWDEWQNAISLAYLQEFSIDKLNSIIVSHPNTLDNGGNFHLSKEIIDIIKHKPSLVVFDGEVYKAVDGQHRINTAKKDNRSHEIYIIPISKKLMNLLLT